MLFTNRAHQSLTLLFTKLSQADTCHGLNQPNVAIDGMTVFHAIVFGFELRLRFD
jgi:hypothetical protein